MECYEADDSERKTFIFCDSDDEHDVADVNFDFFPLDYSSLFVQVYAMKDH